VRNIALVDDGGRERPIYHRKITVDARGEVLDLKDTTNNMVEKLRILSPAK